LRDTSFQFDDVLHLLSNFLRVDGSVQQYAHLKMQFDTLLFTLIIALCNYRTSSALGKTNLGHVVQIGDQDFVAFRFVDVIVSIG
jgi:hypothetical protein